MADEQEAEKPEHPPEVEGKKKSKKKSKKKLIIIMASAVLAAVLGGVLAYTMLLGGKGKGVEAGQKEEKAHVKSVLVPFDPFVLNLAEHGRFLKVTMQLELANGSFQPIVADRIPQLRDAAITLMSSKSAESVSSPEGKFQLKDELLLRANQVMGKDVFKNLYFTEFIMQ